MEPFTDHGPKKEHVYFSPILSKRKNRDHIEIYVDPINKVIWQLFKDWGKEENKKKKTKIRNSILQLIYMRNRICSIYGIKY